MESKGINSMLEDIDMEDDYLDDCYMSDRYYCSYCGLELTLDEYTEHDWGACMEDTDEDDL